MVTWRDNVITITLCQVYLILDFLNQIRYFSITGLGEPRLHVHFEQFPGWKYREFKSRPYG